PVAAPADSSANTAAPAKPAPAAARVPFVPVLISVTDSSGNPVMGLTKEQLSIVDTNQAVKPLQLFKAPDIPLHLGLCAGGHAGFVFAATSRCYRLGTKNHTPKHR